MVVRGHDTAIRVNDEKFQGRRTSSRTLLTGRTEKREKDANNKHAPRGWQGRERDESSRRFVYEIAGRAFDISAVPVACHRTGKLTL
jgi:hypothetical protein